MNTLCFASSLTSEEWAAWVQAIGTILAILAAAGIAIWQSNEQHKLARLMHKEEQRHDRIEQAKTLLALCRSCTSAVKHMRTQLADRDAVHRIAEKIEYFDFGDLQVLVSAVTTIPLHALPDALVRHALILGSAIRQFQQNLNEAVRAHRSMDAVAFREFFTALDKMASSLELSCDDIAKEVERVQRDA
jgi:hypothetical protein